MTWGLMCLIIFLCGMSFQRLLSAWLGSRPIRLTKKIRDKSPSPAHAHAAYDLDGKKHYDRGCLACRLEESGARVGLYPHDEHDDDVTAPGPRYSPPTGTVEAVATALDRQRFDVIRQRIARDGRLLTLPKEGRRGAVQQDERIFYSRLPHDTPLASERAAGAEGWPKFPAEPDASLEDFVNPPTECRPADCHGYCTLPEEEATEPDGTIEADEFTPIGVVLPSVMLEAKSPPPFVTAAYPFPPRRTTAPGGFALPPPKKDGTP